MTPSRQRALIVGLIVIGLVFVGFFGLRTLHAFRDFHGHRPHHFPRPGEEPPAQTHVDLIRDWMTIPYISVTYRLPPNLLWETLKMPPKGNEHKSLKQLNNEYLYLQSDYVLKTVKETILAFQLSTTTPTPTP